MTPDDPRHGTYAGWQYHYTAKTLPPCDECNEARRRYQMRRDKETQLGRPRRLPIEPIRTHLRTLTDAGMSLGDIATAAGLNRQTVESINAAHYKSVSVKVAAALLALKPRPGSGTVPRLGYQRRLRALAWLGWRLSDVTAAAGAAGHTLSVPTLMKLRAPGSSQQRVSSDIALGIAAAYDALSMRLAPSTRAHNVVRAYAHSHGFHPPLAWSDIDDPNERPATGKAHTPKSDVDEAVVLRVMAGERLPMTPAERREIVARLRGRGWSEDRIHAHTGISKATSKKRYGGEAA